MTYQKGDKLPEIFSFIATVVSVCGLFYIHFLASILGGWPYYLSQGAVALQSFFFPMVEGNRDYTRVALRSLIGVSILFLGEDLRQQVLKQQVPLIFGWKLLVCFPLFWGAVGALYTHLKERRII